MTIDIETVQHILGAINPVEIILAWFLFRLDKRLSHLETLFNIWREENGH